MQRLNLEFQAWAPQSRHTKEKRRRGHQWFAVVPRANGDQQLIRILVEGGSPILRAPSCVLVLSLCRFPLLQRSFRDLESLTACRSRSKNPGSSIDFPLHLQSLTARNSTRIFDRLLKRFPTTTTTKQTRKKNKGRSLCLPSRPQSTTATQPLQSRSTGRTSQRGSLGRRRLGNPRISFVPLALYSVQTDPNESFSDRDLSRPFFFLLFFCTSSSRLRH